MTADGSGSPGTRARDGRSGGDDDAEDPRSDADLIARLRGRGADQDSTAAFATLYARHHDAARALARQLARSPSDADDLVAGAFTRMLETLRAGRGPTEAFRAYLLTSLRHLAYDRTRAERRIDLTDEIAEVHGIDPGGTIMPFTDPALAGLERTLAARAFTTLPERWQAVLWHLEVEGDTPSDIAPLFGLSPNAVSALGYRAREGLRQAYLQEHLAAGSGRWDRRHRDTGERLGAYTRGGLSRREAQRVEAHLAECAECRALADELREVNSGMVRAVVAPLVLGAGLVGYLASRGGTGTFALEATTGELAVAGGGALGVLGALSGLGFGSAGAVRSALPGRAGTAGALGLAAAVGVAAFVLGDAIDAIDPPAPPVAVPGLPVGVPPVPAPAPPGVAAPGRPEAALDVPGLFGDPAPGGAAAGAPAPGSSRPDSTGAASSRPASTRPDSTGLGTARPERGIEPTGTAETTETAETIGTAETTGTAETAESARPPEAAGIAKTAESARPPEAAGVARTAETAETARPAGAARTANAGTPAEGRGDRGDDRDAGPVDAVATRTGTAPADGADRAGTVRADTGAGRPSGRCALRVRLPVVGTVAALCPTDAR